jgi:murein L,D-transpeptidase YafK
MKAQRTTFLVLAIVIVVLGFETIRRSFSQSQRKAKTVSQAELIAQKNDTIKKTSVADSIAKANTLKESVFRDKQMTFSRVKNAYNQKTLRLQKLYDSLKIKRDNVNIYLRAFKKEEILEVWAIDQKDKPYVLLTTFKFCKNSGVLGPKRKEGDKQIPEGFYVIDRFNPESKFHLSLGLNFPNRADKAAAKADSSKLGTDIFIHGACETIGCIPITDDKIKELYILAVDAKAAGQGRIPVSIFPTRLTEDNYKALKNEFKDQPKLLSFWKGLKDGFQQFDKCKKLPNIKMLPSGEYLCTSSCK